MAASSSDYFCAVGSPGTATSLQAPGHTIAGTTFNVISTANWPTSTGVIFAMDNYDINTGERVPGSYTEWSGVVTSATTISNAVLRYGTDQNYSASSTTRLYIPVASSQVNRLVDGLLVSHQQDGTLLPAAVQTALGTGNLANTGWNALGYNPNTVTNNGNRSHTCVFNGIDLTGILSAGMRLRLDRTVNAQTQVTSLNGTSQYWTKTSPNKMTFTDDFVVSGWVKLNSYGAASAIVSRYNGSSGWTFRIEDTGRVALFGNNASASNFRRVMSLQSIPLNKWVHVAAQLDMSAYTTSSTTCYVMIDGVDVPAILDQGGTNPTALPAYTADLQVGARNALEFFSGKIAQAAVFNAKVTQATMRDYMNQGLTGTETNLASAYSFNGVATDLNTTTPNDLTASGGAGYSTDSPFSDGENAANGYDYGIVYDKPTFSGGNTTVKVFMANGSAIPTSGGVASVAYSSQDVPYGFPPISLSWLAQIRVEPSTSTSASGGSPILGLTHTIDVPTAARKLKITAYCSECYNTSVVYANMLLMDNGTQIALARNWSHSAGRGVASTLIYVEENPKAGTHTYTINGRAEGGGTAKYTCGTDNPMYLLVEMEL